jgi:RNA polymerase sigma factor (sigma-70 family)
VRGELESKNQRPVTDEEVAASIKSDISRVRLAVSKSLGVPVSMDAPSSRGGRDTTLHDIIPDEHVDEAEESCDQTRRETAVRKLLCLLSPRERRILKGRFWDESTLTSLGLPEGITRERARQIQKEAIEKLRKVAEELGVAKELGISL